MSYTKFEIIPDYRFQKSIKNILAIGALSLILYSLITDMALLTFIGFILVIITVLFFLLSSKKHFKIDEQKIKVETKSVVQVFDEVVEIYFNTIEEVYFLNRQFTPENLFSSKYADLEDQRTYHEYRMVFKLKDNESKTILKVGRKDEFFKAYNIIKNKVDKQTKKSSYNN